MKKLLLFIAFALCANASDSLPIHILPHNCMVGQKAAKEHAGGHNHGSMKTAMYQLVGYNGSQNAKVTYILSTLEKKDIKLKANMINLPKSRYGNYHAISAEVTDKDKIYGATYYIYKHGMPSKTSPTKLTGVDKLTFEIKPNPLPREHDRYKSSKEYSFLVMFKNKPISTDVILTTHNGSKLKLKSDKDGVLEFVMPNDFEDVKNSRGANSASYFTLSSKNLDDAKEYFTTLSMPYYVNPVNYWQSIPYGVVIAILGFLFGLFLYKRSKNG